MKTENIKILVVLAVFLGGFMFKDLSFSVDTVYGDETARKSLQDLIREAKVKLKTEIEMEKETKAYKDKIESFDAKISNVKGKKDKNYKEVEKLLGEKKKYVEGLETTTKKKIETLAGINVDELGIEGLEKILEYMKEEVTREEDSLVAKEIEILSRVLDLVKETQSDKDICQIELDSNTRESEAEELAEKERAKEKTKKDEEDARKAEEAKEKAYVATLEDKAKETLAGAVYAELYKNILPKVFKKDKFLDVATEEDAKNIGLVIGPMIEQGVQAYMAEADETKKNPLKTDHALHPDFQRSFYNPVAQVIKLDIHIPTLELARAAKKSELDEFTGTQAEKIKAQKEYNRLFIELATAQIVRSQLTNHLQAKADLEAAERKAQKEAERTQSMDGMDMNDFFRMMVMRDYLEAGGEPLDDRGPKNRLGFSVGSNPQGGIDFRGGYDGRDAQRGFDFSGGWSPRQRGINPFDDPFGSGGFGMDPRAYIDQMYGGFGGSGGYNNGFSPWGSFDRRSPYPGNRLGL